MGVLGFAGAFAFSHWGIARSTATNAALLITVEPISLMLLSPWLLGERLTRREAAGAALALLGAALVVVNGIPGLTQALVPHWRGDLLLLLAGLAYASYSLFGRGVLARHSSLAVTAWSIAWGALAMAAPGGARVGWRARRSGSPPVRSRAPSTSPWSSPPWAISPGTTALERVPAPRAAIFLNIQPLVGALLGVDYLGEALDALHRGRAAALILAGLSLTLKGQGKG